MYHAAVRLRALVLFSLLLACEKPRERSCRALLIQANDAEATRASPAPVRNVDANRAKSVARWIRATEVEDEPLHGDAEALASALDRLGDARLRIAAARETLDVEHGLPDLIAKAEHVVAAVDRVHRVIPSCTVEGPEDLATRMRGCIDSVPPSDGDVAQPFQEILLDSLWAKEHLPAGRSARETIDRAHDVPQAVADRARAEEDVTRRVGYLREACAH